MSNKINLKNLQSMADEKFKTREVIIGDYSVNIDTVFRDSKITEMIKEFLEKLEYAKENNITINNSDYALLLMTKYFTDIEYPNLYEEQIQVFTILVDLGLLNVILAEFGEEGMKAITEKINVFNENLGKLTDELNKNNTKNFVAKKKK